jgi:hypothetical protein
MTRSASATRLCLCVCVLTAVQSTRVRLDLVPFSYVVHPFNGSTSVSLSRSPLAQMTADLAACSQVDGVQGVLRQVGPLLN